MALETSQRDIFSVDTESSALEPWQYGAALWNKFHVPSIVTKINPIILRCFIPLLAAESIIELYVGNQERSVMVMDFKIDFMCNDGDGMDLLLVRPDEFQIQWYKSESLPPIEFCATLSKFKELQINETKLCGAPTKRRTLCKNRTKDASGKCRFHRNI